MDLLAGSPKIERHAQRALIERVEECRCSYPDDRSLLRIEPQRVAVGRRLDEYGEVHGRATRL